MALPYDTEAALQDRQSWVRWEWTKSYTQAGLPHSGLPHHGDHLAVPAPGPRQRLRQRRDLGLPSDKAGQASSHPGLQAPPHATAPTSSNTSTAPQPLDRHRA